MNAHIGKPFRREELMVAAANAISGKLAFETVPETGVTEAGDDPALDWRAIERFRADSGEEMLQLLVDTFVEDAQEKLTRLAALAHLRTTGTEAVVIAHSLKSAGAMAGAAALSRIAARIEKELAQDATALDANDAAVLADAFAKYRTALATRGLVTNG